MRSEILDATASAAHRPEGPGPEGGSGRDVLSVDEVSVSFGGLRALSRVSLRVPHGSIVSLIGPNGAGKTTLFDVISGFRTPDEGRVVLAGTDVTGAAPAARAKMGLVRTFQRMELFEDLTVLENLVVAREARLPLRLLAGMFRGRRLPRPEVEDAEELAVLLGLFEVLDVRVVDLPTGLRRMVELGRCLMVETRVMLLDEPSSGLDAAETAWFSGVLRTLTSPNGRAIFVVEHDMTVALGLADYVYVLDFGQLIAEGTPDEVRADPRVQSAYLGKQSASVAEDA